MGAESVFQYLQNQNRPYSVNDIIQNMNKELGKTGVQKALDKLVKDGKIIEKSYGKQKVYCIKQLECDGDMNAMQDELNELDQKCIELAGDLKNVEEKLRASEIELKQLNSSLTTEEATKKRDALKSVVSQLTEKLEKIRSFEVIVPIDEKRKITKEYEKAASVCRKRKRICMDILNEILESYPKSKKCLLEEIGIETDENVGFTLKINT